MRFKAYSTLIGLHLLFLGDAQAASPNLTDTNHTTTLHTIQTHVRFLSADALEGRLTGTVGEKIATQYIANQFRLLGLDPAGDKGTFFQEFDFTSGVSLGKNNVLIISNQTGAKKQLMLDQEWRPLSFTDNKVFDSKELVFAGYGMTVPALEKLPTYDSYHGLDVKNKWVVVLKHLPTKMTAERTQQLSPYSSLRYKAFTAKEHGAIGIIFVGDALIPLSFDTVLSGSGIIALSIKVSALGDLTKLRGIRLTGQTNVNKIVHRGRNVLAKLKVHPKATSIIVVGAHIDHLGRGELSGSRARNDEVGQIHPGADDNASGVASMLAAAAELSQKQAHGLLHGKNDILFAAWSGEEFGILGSSHFMANFTKEATIDAAINLDMVGHLREKLVLQGVGSSSDWPEIIKRASVNHAIAVLTQTDPYLPTDSTSFYLQGIPTINFFTGAHDNYHTPRDKADTLNYEGIKKISAFLVDLILTLEDTPRPIDYREVKKTSNNDEQEFRIYLGTIPDYASTDVSGVKLAGVTKDSPAEHAGIKHHDIIIELDGKSIHDIYDYTFVLNSLNVDVPIKMVVLRGGKIVTLKIIARYRE